MHVARVKAKEWPLLTLEDALRARDGMLVRCGSLYVPLRSITTCQA